MQITLVNLYFCGMLTVVIHSAKNRFEFTDIIIAVCRQCFTAWRYATAVYAAVLRLSICLSVRPSQVDVLQNG